MYFFPQREQICPKEKEKVDFLDHILLKYYWGRIFNFSSKKFSFVPFSDVGSLAQRGIRSSDYSV